MTAAIILFSILIFSEVTSYIFLKRLFKNKKKFNWVWFAFTILIYISFAWANEGASLNLKKWFVNYFAAILITKLVASLVFIISECIRLIKKNISKNKIDQPIDISRREFSSKIALGAATIPFFSINWGIFRTAYNFEVIEQKIKLKNLPESFKGFKIVQISDIHTGSLQNHHQLQKAIEIINSQKADIVCFTGDLVNSRTDEVFPYMEDLKQIQAKHGVLSILGNHDYGDYEKWPSESEKDKNFQEMLDVHSQLGWRLLMNEHIVIQKQDSELVFLGVENWGANLHFPKYGKLAEAVQNVNPESSMILLSHDPSHFDNEITIDFKSIDLTLSGHTHGFQFGIEIPGYIKWSPSQYIYKQWAGLYNKGSQQLYVNRGLGCLGYMGRIGIRPEITVIELV